MLVGDAFKEFVSSCNVVAPWGLDDLRHNRPPDKRLSNRRFAVATSCSMWAQAWSCWNRVGGLLSILAAAASGCGAQAWNRWSRRLLTQMFAERGRRWISAEGSSATTTTDSMAEWTGSGLCTTMLACSGMHGATFDRHTWDGIDQRRLCCREHTFTGLRPKSLAATQQ